MAYTKPKALLYSIKKCPFTIATQYFVLVCFTKTMMQSLKVFDF